MTTKPSHRLTLRDRLSRLDFLQACKLLGPEGRRLIQLGGKFDIVLADQVYMQGDLFRVTFPNAVVTMTLMADARQRVHWNCTGCDFPCEHAGAAFSLILEEKLALGLAAPPKERIPVESLGEDELVARAIAEREERARKERFRLQSNDPARPWAEYAVTSAASGKTYRVSLRGRQPGSSYCSCPDFRTNTLGTCKHILHVLRKIQSKFPAATLRRLPKRRELTVRLVNGESLGLRFDVPANVDADVSKVLRGAPDRELTDVHDLVRRLAKLERLGQPVTVYPDAEEFIQRRLFQSRMESLVAEVRRDPARHPLRLTLLKVELLPYQMDGVAFAAGAGRAILADDMGLGKTIQGVGVAELLAREAEVRRVLVVCPTSLKSQWRAEIFRFSDRSCQLILGSAADRPAQYHGDAFFTVCNYEQVLRDLPTIESVAWDLIILDEGQRIKNWEAKTTHVVKRLKSTFALVLSGTPLENRLDDLYSVVQFVDDRRLGPAFRFFNRHRVVDEKGKVLGYKNLDGLRKNLQPILLRRTRDEVLKQLPARTTEIVRIAPTGEQAEIHQGQMRVVASIVGKSYISEMDLLRLRQALLMCRMAADSSYLCTKLDPGYSSKLERLDDLCAQLFADPTRKVVLFSEWTTMLSLIENQILKPRKLRYVRLDGGVPQKKRHELVHEFQTDPACRLFITTNAGSTGLNLQAANTVINVDLPWNPAVLEQRIARVHRMGQKQPVEAYLLVTEETIEENLLGTLSAKRDLALAALDVDSDVDEVSLVSGAEELRSRLEVLLGARPEAAVDVSQSTDIGRRIASYAAPATWTGDPADAARRERVAAAGGELLGALFQFLGELTARDETAPPPQPELVANLRNRLASCVDEDDAGRQRLTMTLPGRESLDQLANTLARLMVI